MAKFVVTNSLGGTQQPLTTSYKTIIALTAQAASLARFRVCEITVGTNGTPNDNYIEWDISEQTAAGTATTVIPNGVDPSDDTTARTLAVVNATAEGTVTPSSSVLYFGINQRATLTKTISFTAPAVNLAGFAIRARSGGYTGTVTLTVNFEE